MRELEFTVWELTGCPYFAKHKPVTKEGVIAFTVGAERHKVIQELLRRRGFIIEQAVNYYITYKNTVVLIKGRIDAIDPVNKIIYEIKPANLTMRGIRQLALYRDLYYLDTKQVYDIGFILYRKHGETLRLSFINNMLYKPRLLEMFNNVIEIIKHYIDRDEPPRVSCDDCKYCELRNECKPVLKYFGLNLVPLRK